MNYKWTVLFLVHASNKQTKEHVDELFTILENAQNSEQIKVLILYGGLKCSITEGYSNEVTLHEVVRKKTSSQSSTSPMLANYGAIDIGDDKKIKGIFAEIRNKYPSDRFLLFTWDHGSGFGIFKTDPRERSLFSMDGFAGFGTGGRSDNSSRALNFTREATHFEVITNYSYTEGTNSRDFGDTRGIEKEKLKTSMLTNDEIGSIILYDAEATKVDLLIMMNCAMQLIETGYALHNAVEYLIAPETCIFWAGYDYKSILSKLCADPDIETETLGRYALDTIQAYYETTTSKEYFNDLVVSLVKPARSLKVKAVMDEIAGHLIDKLPDSFDAIKNIRQNCKDLTEKFVAGVPYHYVDLLNCISGLNKASDKINVEKLQLALQAYVIHIIKGNNYQNVDGRGNIGQVNGCTIYYPPDAHDAGADVYYDWFYKSGDQQTLFAAQCLWKNFLLDYFHQDRKHKKNIS